MTVRLAPMLLLAMSSLVAASTAACAKEGAATSSAASAATPPSAAPGSTPAPAAPAVVSGPTEVTVGKPAPAFSVKASDGTALDTAKLRGRPIVVYFYPKDETPGCTKEACAFRDAWDALAKTQVALIGVSGDSDASHKEFAAHHRLPFHLVSDADGALAKAFDVPTFGRQSFIIGADGNVKKIYRSVNVSAHAQEILADLK